ncbi:MAG TPA: flagellar FlbD family protein [Polyangiaceae bacterium]|nr:flagellar FlbD family protein [Polyangiaceae bacterium]
MICVTRIKGQRVALNPDLIETVEEMPDTTVRLVSGENILVRETLAEIIELTVQYRRRIHQARLSEVPPPSDRPPVKSSWSPRGPLSRGGE